MLAPSHARRPLAMIAAGLALVAALPFGLSRFAAAQDQEKPKADGAPRVAGRALSPEVFGEIMAGLKQTPGCVGTDFAQMQSGKLTIFAWFEDKKSVLAWHDGPAHRKLLEGFGMKGSKDYKAMTDIPDDAGPILVVASAVPPRPAADGKPAQNFQLGIELYAPLTGGVRFGGGSFAPEGFREAMKAKDGPAK